MDQPDKVANPARGQLKREYKGVVPDGQRALLGICVERARHVMVINYSCVDSST